MRREDREPDNGAVRETRPGPGIEAGSAHRKCPRLPPASLRHQGTGDDLLGSEERSTCLTLSKRLGTWTNCGQDVTRSTTAEVTEHKGQAAGAAGRVPGAQDPGER